MLKLLTVALLVILCWVPGNTKAQTQRVQQVVKLGEPANAPLFVIGVTLPDIALRGIRSGSLKPVFIDYEKNLVKTLSVDEYRLRLAFVPMEFDTTEYVYEAETSAAAAIEEEESARPGLLVNWTPDESLKQAGNMHLLRPFELNTVLLDVSKENGKVTAINYVHFYGADPDFEQLKYRFSLPYAALHTYLNEQKVLWVKNTNPLVWKNQVLNTSNWRAADKVRDMFPEADFGDIHFVEKKPFRKTQVEVYSRNKLVRKLPYADLAASGGKPEMLWMSDALQDGLYRVQEELPLTTTVKPGDEVVSLAAEPAEFYIIQKENLVLNQPENKKFFRKNQELPSFILKAVEAGLLRNIYRNDSLAVKLTKQEFHKNISIDNYGLVLTDSVDEAAGPLLFGGHDLSVMVLTWKVNFNDKGEIINYEPHALTLILSAEASPVGIEVPVGSFAFTDVEQALKQLPEYRKAKGNMLSGLRKRKYYGFLESTSSIRAAGAP